MIRTELIKPVTYTHELKKVSTEKITKKEERRFGLFGYKTKTTDVVVELDIYDLDNEQLSKYPKHVQKYFRCKKRDKYGFLQINMINNKPYHTTYAYFSEPITVTLNNFCKKHNITEEKLKNIEWCKNGCSVTGVYITWDDNT